MSIELNDDLEIGDPLAFANWALQTQVWNGRQVSWEEASEFCEEVKLRILETLFQEQSDSAFERLAAQYAWLGSTDAGRTLLAKDIQALDFSTKDEILQVGFRKSISKFWKKHKKEILIGVAVAVVITVVVVVAVSTGGTAAGGAAAAGGVAIDELTKKDFDPPKVSNRKPWPENPRLNQPQESFIANPPPQSLSLDRSTMIESPGFDQKPFQHPLPRDIMMEPLPFAPPPPSLTQDKLIFGEKGILFDGHYSSYNEILGREPSMIHSPPFEGNFPSFPSAPEERPRVTNVIDMIKKEIFGLENSNDSFSIREPSCYFTTIEDNPSYLRIAGINGMNNSFDDAVDNMSYLQSLAPRQKVDWVYNRSHGPVIDTAEIFTMNYPGISPNTEQLLIQNWTAFHLQNMDRPNAKYLQFCHSQGALHVRNSLAHLPEEIKKRIIVVAIAPAAVVPKEVCYQSFNYACEGDVVPYGELVYRGALDPNECGMSKLLEQAIEYQDQIIWLKPEPNSTESAHSFQNPVFEEHIRIRIEEYLNNNGEYK